MVKEIALDLNEKTRLETNLQLLTLERSTYSSLTQNLEITLNQKDLQIQLLQKTNTSLELQQTLKKPPKNIP